MSSSKHCLVWADDDDTRPLLPKRSRPMDDELLPDVGDLSKLRCARPRVPATTKTPPTMPTTKEQP